METDQIHCTSISIPLQNKHLGNRDLWYFFLDKLLFSTIIDFWGLTSGQCPFQTISLAKTLVLAHIYWNIHLLLKISSKMNLRLDLHFPQICRIKCLENLSRNMTFSKWYSYQPALIIKCKDVWILACVLLKGCFLLWGSRKISKRASYTHIHPHTHSNTCT